MGRISFMSRMWPMPVVKIVWMSVSKILFTGLLGTMLMNIRNLQWDTDLCQWGRRFVKFRWSFLFRFFGIPGDILPEIKSSATIFGYINKGPLKGIPIGAVRKRWVNACRFILLFLWTGTWRSTSSTCWSTLLGKRNSQEHVSEHSFFLLWFYLQFELLDMV